MSCPSPLRRRVLSRVNQHLCHVGSHTSTESQPRYPEAEDDETAKEVSESRAVHGSSMTDSQVVRRRTSRSAAPIVGVSEGLAGFSRPGRATAIVLGMRPAFAAWECVRVLDIIGPRRRRTRQAVSARDWPMRDRVFAPPAVEVPSSPMSASRSQPRNPETGMPGSGRLR